MNTWSTDELANINAIDELHLFTLDKNGKLRNPVTIWDVRVGNNIFIRAVKGTEGLWYRHAIETHKGHVEAGGVKKDVTFVEVNDMKDDIDKAYQSKYNGYGSSIVNSTVTPQAQAATLKLLPL